MTDNKYKLSVAFSYKGEDYAFEFEPPPDFTITGDAIKQYTRIAASLVERTVDAADAGGIEALVESELARIEQRMGIR